MYVLAFFDLWFYKRKFNLDFLSVVLLSACRDRNVQVSYKSALSKGPSILIKFSFYWKIFISYQTLLSIAKKKFFIEYWCFHREKKYYTVLLNKGSLINLTLKPCGGLNLTNTFSPYSRLNPTLAPNPCRWLTLTLAKSSA